MPRHSSSKRSITSRAARATKRDQQEARLQQAAAEVGNGTYDSIRKAAAAHSVPEATLCHRLEGRPPKKGAQDALQKLTPAAEQALVQHIKRCALSGYPLTPVLLCKYANTITHVPAGSNTPPKVSHTWLQLFLLQHDSIRSHWSRCLDNSRITGATKDNVNQWFIQLANILREYSVASTNIFNMDKTGFMFSQAASERVVIPSGDPGSCFKAQPGSQESATVIECIGSGGQILPPLIITKGRIHTVGEHRQMDGMPPSWHFSKTANGWTNNELAIEWFTQVFEPSTKPPSSSDWRLLILNGHSSHTSAEFCDALWLHRVIPFLLPAHATHVMQPLNVSIFGPLTGMFKRLVSMAAEQLDSINKAQFGTLYAQARERVLTQSAARKAFADCCISLTPSPDKVLARLAGGSDAAQQQTPTPVQEQLIPRSDAALEATIEAHRQETDLQEA